MDELLIESIELILTNQMASKAFLQRQLRIGYERASKLIDIIEIMGIIGPEVTNQPRCLNITLNEWMASIDKKNENEIIISQSIDEITTNKIYERIIESSDLSISELWKKISFQLRTELSEISYNTWFQDIEVKIIGNEMQIITRNNFHKEIIEKRYISLITSLLQMYTDSNLSLKIVSA